MSRELLKRALESMRRTRSIPTGESIDTMRAIEDELAKPDQEPVAWMSKTFPTTFAISKDVAQPEMFFTPLYTTPPDQSSRIAELEKDNNITHENLAWYMEKYHEHLTIIAELEKSEAFLKDAVDRAIQDTEYYQEQLAALQAKRDPLSVDEIANMWIASTTDVGNSTIHDYMLFAREIERSHGIGGE